MTSTPANTEHIPRVELRSLDELWFQVSGTLCNLECTHCFISCSPKNDSFGYLSLDEVAAAIEESLAWGVKEYYFTGGEPFLNRDIVPILELTLQYGPATVLTNGTVLKPEWLERLKAAEAGSLYSLEFRVSIDGPTPEINDPIRGERTFERAMQGVELLSEFGFLPIITMTRTWEEPEDEPILARFRQVHKEHGCLKPRLKILPRLKIGAEAPRTEGYHRLERITPELMAGYDQSQLICNHSRVVTSKGVYVCPILLESPEARLGSTLAEANRDFPLAH
jgi:sulfatase maturation enzyme AslB (radical SAM superfamily)